MSSLFSAGISCREKIICTAQDYLVLPWKKKLTHSVHAKAIHKIPVFMQSIYRAANDTGWIDKTRRVKANRISDVISRLFFTSDVLFPRLSTDGHKRRLFFRCERHLNHFETMLSVQGGLVALGCRSLTLFHNPHDGLQRPGSYSHVIARWNRKTERVLYFDSTWDQRLSKIVLSRDKTS